MPEVIWLLIGFAGGAALHAAGVWSGYRLANWKSPLPELPAVNVVTSEPKANVPAYPVPFLKHDEEAAPEAVFAGEKP